MFKKTRSFYFFAGFLAAIILFIILGTSVKDDGSVTFSSPLDLLFPHKYRIITPHIPDNLSFAGERIPMENWEARERIEREFLVNTYLHSSTVIAIKRINRYFPVIEPILKRNKIPDDFKYLALIESHFGFAVSPAGATGFWQFLDSAGKEFGLEINSEVDERYHMEKATEAACKYLSRAYNLFGSWTMAAASYNMGMRGVERQLERQKSSNYFNLAINEETSRYIARIIAVKQILNNPKLYGYDINQNELYKPLKYTEVSVDYSIPDLADFAENHGINYKTLKIYNPWLRDNKLTNKNKKTYKIAIPDKGEIELIR